MGEIVNPFNFISKAKEPDTPCSKKEFIKKLEHPDTMHALQLGNEVERNQSRRDLAKEEAEKNKKLVNLQSKQMRHLHKANADLERQKNKEIQKRQELERQVQALMNERMERELEVNSRSKEVAVPRVVRKRPKHVVPKPIDPSIHETLDSCRLSLPDLDRKKSSSKRKWKPTTLLPKHQMKSSKTSTKHTRRRKESNLPKPRALQFGDVKGVKKQSKLPKSYQQQRKWVRNLQEDFMEERYDSDNSLFQAVKRSSIVTRKPHNPFKKKNPKQPMKNQQKQQPQSEEEHHRKRRRVQKRQTEVIVIAESSTDDDNTSSDESQVS